MKILSQKNYQFLFSVFFYSYFSTNSGILDIIQTNSFNFLIGWKIQIFIQILRIINQKINIEISLYIINKKQNI